MEKELIWKNIPGFNGKYQANIKGEIRSTSYEGHNYIKKIKQQKRKDGYLQVQLYDKKYLVHRLIALTFIDNVDSYCVVNHKNGIKNDNRMENLEWVTSSENIKHAYNSGLKRKLFGKEHPNSKSVYQIDKNSNEILNKYQSIDEAKSITGIKHISCVCLGKRKTAGGYIWRYVNENNK